MLVVGAGPAGSAAAYHLSRHGADVLMVDRATFPREKVCGDGLTPRGVRAMQRMGIDPTEPGFTRVDGLRSYGLDGRMIDLRWPTNTSFPDFGVVRTRFDFDELLVQRAIKAGVRFLPGTEAVAPAMEARRVVGAEISNGDGPMSVRTRQVVAADGASSRFGARAGGRRIEDRPIAAAARRYYRSQRSQEPVLESFLNLVEPGGVLAGYGWVFPLGDGLWNVGVGILRTDKHDRDTTARKVMDRFVAQLPPEWGMAEDTAVGPLMSGPIPMGVNRRPLAVPGMLLVGDAGGIVNPFNGEGIAYAIETGELAAELIVDGLARGRSAVPMLYPLEVRHRYARYFRVGRAWLGLLGHPRFMRFGVKHGLPREALMRFALKFMANLSDGKEGDATDRMVDLLVSAVPEGP